MLNKILKINYDTQDHIRLDKDGNWEKSERPMIEEIHELKFKKDKTLLLYFKNLNKPMFVKTSTGREIRISVQQPLTINQDAK